MKGEILVAATDIGADECGELNVVFSIRDSGKDAWQGQDVIPFPVASLLVEPRGVLFWDQVKPDKPNSFKRFGYMLGLRAVPTALCEEDPTLRYPPHFSEVNRRNLTAFMEHYLSPEGRYSARPNSDRRARTKAFFRYRPPEGDLLRLLQCHLMERIDE